MVGEMQIRFDTGRIGAVSCQNRPFAGTARPGGPTSVTNEPNPCGRDGRDREWAIADSEFADADMWSVKRSQFSLGPSAPNEPNSTGVPYVKRSQSARAGARDCGFVDGDAWSGKRSQFSVGPSVPNEPNPTRMQCVKRSQFQGSRGPCTL